MSTECPKVELVTPVSPVYAHSQPRKAQPHRLEKHPSVKALHDELFKGRPELLNEESVLSAVNSRLLNYDEDTGQVRDSVADVRMKHMLPAVPTTATSLQIKKEGEFDRLLLLVFGCFLAGLNIPSAFLKSSYFTPRAQLQQIFAKAEPFARVGILKERRGNV